MPHYVAKFSKVTWNYNSIPYFFSKVAPAELESLLLKHEAVADVAVVGIPDEEAGELPKAFVVKRKEVTEKELLHYVNGT